jgi:hypothetical protein
MVPSPCAAWWAAPGGTGINDLPSILRIDPRRVERDADAKWLLLKDLMKSEEILGRIEGMVKNFSS